MSRIHLPRLVSSASQFPPQPPSSCLLSSPFSLQSSLRRATSPVRIAQLSAATYSSAAYQVFDRRVKRLQRDRAGSNVEVSRRADYLRDEVASRLTERLLLIKRDFPRVLDFGANACNVARALAQPNRDPDHALSPPIGNRIQELVALDSSAPLLYRDEDASYYDGLNIRRQLVPDEEVTPLPFPPESFDLCLSSMSLHWINDLPTVLQNINTVLKPDCPFIGAMVGGDSLYELRSSFHMAELERRGGVAPRVSPLADVRDVGNLLQRAGFTMLTVDVDDIIVDYPDPFHLLEDLQAMGENHALHDPVKKPLSQDLLVAMDGIYRTFYGNEDGTIPATFRIIYMIGWKKGENQPKPLARGSGEVSLKDILETRSTEKS